MPDASGNPRFQRTPPSLYPTVRSLSPPEADLPLQVHPTAPPVSLPPHPRPVPTLRPHEPTSPPHGTPPPPSAIASPAVLSENIPSHRVPRNAAGLQPIAPGPSALPA